MAMSDWNITPGQVPSVLSLVNGDQSAPQVTQTTNAINGKLGESLDINKLFDAPGTVLNAQDTSNTKVPETPVVNIQEPAVDEQSIPYKRPEGVSPYAAKGAYSTPSYFGYGRNDLFHNTDAIGPNRPKHRFLTQTTPGAPIPTKIITHGIEYTITGIDQNYYRIGDVYTVRYPSDENNPKTGCVLASIVDSTLVFKRVILDNELEDVEEVIVKAQDIAAGKAYLMRHHEINEMALPEYGWGYERN